MAMEESEELELDLEGGNTRNNNSVLSSSSTPRRPSQPPAPRITVSVPGKVQTATGPLFRDGGFLMMRNGELQLFFLYQVYKEKDGYCWAVAG